MNRIILVSGFPRCGSSLVMQMLHAGGVCTTGVWPAFEDTRFVVPGLSAEYWRAQAGGRAVKLLDPHRHPPPKGLNIHAVWLSRDPKEQAKSQVKFGATMLGLPSGRRELRAFKADNAANQSAALSVLKARCGIVLRMRFEEILANPFVAATSLAVLVDGVVDANAMARVVRTRSPECLTGMLEISMITALR